MCGCLAAVSRAVLHTTSLSTNARSGGTLSVEAVASDNPFETPELKAFMEKFNIPLKHGKPLPPCRTEHSLIPTRTTGKDDICKKFSSAICRGGHCCTVQYSFASTQGNTS